MKRFLPVILVLGLAASLFLFTSACNKSTLEPGGAYAPVAESGGVTNASPNMPLFLADSAYKLAYSAINTVFETERGNRAFLFKVSPSIKDTLDEMRPKAVTFNKDYLLARAVYIANPAPANLTGVQAALGKIQQLAVTAQAALPQQ